MKAHQFIAMVAALSASGDPFDPDGEECPNGFQHDADNSLDALDEIIHKARKMQEPPAAFVYEKWRHGGWYVQNVRYLSGACGCVSNNYDDKKWRIACDPRPFEKQPTFKTRDDAARAEWVMVEAEKNKARAAGVELYRALSDMHRAFGDDRSTPFKKAICEGMDKALALVSGKAAI